MNEETKQKYESMLNEYTEVLKTLTEIQLFRESDAVRNIECKWEAVQMGKAVANEMKRRMDALGIVYS